MYFYFFFDKLYHIPEIQEAFSHVCIDKMLYDGYCDMSCYIKNSLTKEDMLHRLAICKSKYMPLFQTPFPSDENAYNYWYSIFQQSHNTKASLKFEEAIAIVYWTYMIFNEEEKRIEFTFELFSYVKDFHEIKNNIEYKDGVFYNAETIELKIVSSIAGFNDAMSQYQKSDDVLYYRGHSNANYKLLPSILRKTSWTQNEREMYHDLLINCPADFEKCNSHLEKLVKMQHYGLPTRLLDITKNPLVALYFACESQPDSYGEIVLIATNKNSIYYSESDTASILASLPAFSYAAQMNFLNWSKDLTISKADFNKKVSKLIHEIRLEKPAFREEIEKTDLSKNIIVLAIKNNSRIIKQDGAFILCGLSDNTNALNHFRYKKKGKTLVVLVSNKKKIMNQLSAFSINRATLFPEIECVAEYIKNTY